MVIEMLKKIIVMVIRMLKKNIVMVIRMLRKRVNSRMLTWSAGHCSLSFLSMARMVWYRFTCKRQEAGVEASRRLLLLHLLRGVRPLLPRLRCLGLDQLLLRVLHLLSGCGGHAGNCQKLELEVEEGVQSVLPH